MRKLFRGGGVLGLCLAMAGSAWAGDQVFQSTPERVGLLELYTSEGCSSCPPAEAWLSKLKSDPGLWHNFVPVSFHVTYWDNLGWPDKYASSDYTARQYALASVWHSTSVYTPEFVLNGQEWHPTAVPTASKVNAGILRAKVDDKRNLVVNYIPAAAGKSWEVHVALLGCGLVTAVKAGENRGLSLPHDFVVLSLQSAKLGHKETALTLAAAKPGEKGIAIWVTEEGKLEPTQAAGGWLN